MSLIQNNITYPYSALAASYSARGIQHGYPSQSTTPQGSSFKLENGILWGCVLYGLYTLLKNNQTFANNHSTRHNKPSSSAGGTAPNTSSPSINAAIKPLCPIPNAFALPLQQRTIVFISGHGGRGPNAKGYHDTGCVGHDGHTIERELCEAVTHRQMKVLRNLGYNVIEIETKYINGKPSLDQQRDLKATYPNTPIIHNHFNSSSSNVSGSEVYYVSSAAKQLAQQIQQPLNQTSQTNGFQSRYSKWNDFKVLNTIDMNQDGQIDQTDEAMDLSVLIEYDYMSNPAVLKQLKKGLNDPDGNNYLNQKADAAAAGIARFLHQRN